MKSTAKFLLLVVSLFMSVIGMHSTSQDGSTDEAISTENVSNMSLLGTFSSLEENDIHHIEWLSSSISSFAVYGNSGVWIYQADDLEGEPRYFSGRGVLSQDGHYWAIQNTRGQRGTTQIFDTISGTQLHILQHGQVELSNEFNPLTFNFDSTKIASAWGDTIRIWDTTTGSLISEISTEGIITSLSFNLEGSLIGAALYDGTVRVWDSSTGQTVAEIQDHFNLVYPHFVSSENWLLTSSIDRTVTLWDLTSKTRLLFVPAHTDLVHAQLTGSGENIVVADASVQQSTNYSVLEIWNIALNKHIATYELVYDGIGFLIPGSIVFDTENRLVIFWTANEQALLIDAEAGQQLYAFMHSDAVRGAIFNVDSSLVVSWSDELYFWDVETGELVISIATESIQDVIFSPDGSRMITAHIDGSIRLWGIR